MAILILYGCGFNQHLYGFAIFLYNCLYRLVNFTILKRHFYKAILTLLILSFPSVVTKMTGFVFELTLEQIVGKYDFIVPANGHNIIGYTMHKCFKKFVDTRFL